MIRALLLVTALFCAAPAAGQGSQGWTADVIYVPTPHDVVEDMLRLVDLNVRLRPRLWAELRPGTRIVSHQFDMGDWQLRRSWTSTGGRSTSGPCPIP